MPENSGRFPRLQYLFTSTEGLLLMALAITGVITVIGTTLSGPMAELGIKDITVQLLNMDMVESQREGRIVILYHSIAMIVMAMLVYMITANVPMKRNQIAVINGIVTAGYLTTIIAGLIFAYFGHNWTFHGIYLFGLSLVFLSGALLTIALWPWRKEYYLEAGSPYARAWSGLDLERLAFWVMAMATLGSAMLGAWSGSYFGNGFTAFLSEDIIRYPNQTMLQKAVTGHLHIMLALIAVALTLILGRWYGFKGPWHKFAMPTMILGTIVLTLGAWSVTVTPSAHTIIFVGSFFAMLGGLYLVIYALPNITRERLQEQGLTKPTLGQKAKALLHDPLKFGAVWQMIFMNFTVSFVGIFMAVKLDEIIRVWPHREERIELVGHWHILAAIIATIMLFYIADRLGLKGKIRQWFGWLVIIGSDMAFAAVALFEMKRLFVTEHMQQPVVNRTMLLTDVGLAAVIIVLAAFLLWRLFDLLKSKGRWKSELAETELFETRFGMTVREDEETIPVDDQSPSSTEQEGPQ